MAAGKQACKSLLLWEAISATILTKGEPFEVPTWVSALRSLSSSHAPQLVTALVIVGVVWLVIPGRRLAVAAFLAQRAIALILPWPSTSDSQAAISMLAWFAVAIILTGTAWCAKTSDADQVGDPNGPKLFHTNLPFRALAASLTLLLARWLAQTYASRLPPPLIAFTSVWLVAMGLLALLLAGSGMGVGLGALTFADGCRVLYTLAQPSLPVWAIWNIGDTLVALAASHLESAEAIASHRSMQGRS